MSAQFASEHACYVNCNYCNTILVVNVPNSCSHNIVTVKCGHCTMVLSMDLSPFHQQARTVPDNQIVQNRGFQYNNFGSYEQASSRNLRTPSMYPVSNNQPQVPSIRPPEKRQRVPSAYNRFIKEEIQRIKMSNPEISHREAFSAAAKNGSSSSAPFRPQRRRRRRRWRQQLEMVDHVVYHVIETTTIVRACVWIRSCTHIDRALRLNYIYMMCYVFGVCVVSLSFALITCVFRLVRTCMYPAFSSMLHKGI